MLQDEAYRRCWPHRDTKELPRVNLERILQVGCLFGSVALRHWALLQVKFPSPKTSKREDFSMECAICYAYRLADVREALLVATCGSTSVHHACAGDSGPRVRQRRVQQALPPLLSL